jgi:hypothetical protein
VSAFLLRVVHPSIDPRQITEELGLPPQTVWRADGETVWQAPLAGSETGHGDVNAGLRDIAARFEHYRFFVDAIRAEGGRVEIMVGDDGNEAPNTAMRARFADLGIVIASWPSIADEGLTAPHRRVKLAVMRWLLAIAALSVAGPVNAMGVRESGRWTAVCDNQRSCTAILLSQEADGAHPERSAGYVTITRDGGADHAPVVTFKLQVGGKLRLLFDSKLVRSLSSPKILGMAFDGPDLLVTAGYVPYEGPQAKAFLAALRNARTLTIERKTGDTLTFDLAGAADALSWIDREQYRAHATAALWDTGSEAENLPPIPALPKIALAPQADRSNPPPPPAELMARVSQARCGGEPAALFIQQRLAPDTVLWAPGCGTGGTSRDIYLGDDAGGHLRAAELPTPPDIDAASFHASLSGANGDKRFVGYFPFETWCGREIDWAWTGQGFVVAQERLVLDCKGVDSEERPVIYRTEITH